MERVQRFGKGERGWAFIAPGDPIPDTGWAVQAVTRAVYHDGEIVGTCTDWQVGTPGDRAYKELRYEPLDHAE